MDCSQDHHRQNRRLLASGKMLSKFGCLQRATRYYPSGHSRRTAIEATQFNMCMVYRLYFSNGVKNPVAFSGTGNASLAANSRVGETSCLDCT